MRRYLRVLLPPLMAIGLFAAVGTDTDAAVSITGAVGTSGKYLVTGMPVTSSTPAVLKLTFENLTLGTNLELCAGTAADFQSGTCPIALNGSGGPGFRFLTIVDVATISGKILYVKRAVGNATSKFTLTIE